MTNFNFKKIDAPGPAGTYAYISADGVDLAGEAVGNYGNVDGEGDGTFHGFTAQAGGSFTTFDPVGSTNTDVVGITTSGEIFGNYVDNVLKQHGFVDNGGVVTQIDEFLANSTTVSGVNDEGVIYGSFADFANSVHGFVDNGGTYTQIDVPGVASTAVVGVNAAGTIVGTYTDAQFKAHGFVESGGSFKTIDPAGSIFTSVVGVSDAGVVVGNYQDSANNQHSFIDDNGVITTISIPGATTTGISAINAAGEIVGYYADGVGNIHGFIDENGSIITVDIPGATQTDILGISASGEITGYYNDSSYIQHGFVGAPATTLIQTDGSTSLTQVGFNYFLYAAGGTSGPELNYLGAPVVAGEGQLSDWTPIGAVQTSSGYDVAWKDASTGQYSVWTTDSNGIYIGSTGAVAATSVALEAYETTLHQDLNGDGTIGIPTTLIQTDGSTSLTEVGSNYFLYAVGGMSGPELNYLGAPVVAGEGQLSDWAPIGAVQTSSGYDVAWKDASTGQYSVWTTDSNGIYIGSTGAVAGTSIALEAYEPAFLQDLNGDGTLGVVTTVIETAGSTTLEEVGNNFFLLSGGSIPTLKVDGTPFVTAERGDWTPIGAEEITTPVNDTYDVALKVAGADQYVVWSVDSDGNYIAALTGTLSGTSATLESYEPIFQQDLNGDGSIGIVTTVIEAAGSTALTEVANNFYLYSGGVGPELNFNGTPYVDGEFGAWTLIGAEQVSGGGYDLP